MQQIKTNWFVITGGPSAGKSKTLEHLSFRGHKIISEAARILIDDEMSRGKTLDEIRGDEQAFQEKILQMKLDIEEMLNPEERLFLDRGIADSVAYFKLTGADPRPAIEVSKLRIYKIVFLLDQVPFQRDNARVEDADLARRINDLLYETYSELGSEIVRVPVMPIAERVNFILAKANNT